MNRTAVLAQRICEQARQLPEASLLELERYIEFLRFKDDKPGSSLEQMALLAQLADERDYQKFSALLAGIDWSSRSPAELTMAIDLAVKLRMGIAARGLAQLGSRLHPEDEHIRQANQVLSPPIARSRHLPQARGLDASKSWLRDHANEHRGQWIAVRDGKLLGAAITLEDLRLAIGQSQDAVSTIVTRIPE